MCSRGGEGVKKLCGENFGGMTLYSLYQTCGEPVETYWNDFGGTAVVALCKHGDFGKLNPAEDL